jgi:hypothetical protein
MALAMAGFQQAAQGEPAKADRPNIALGRSYTFNTRPNYTFSAKDGGLKQLTDGQFTDGYFWTEPSTVGWMHTQAGRVIITLDLGEIRPISGVMFSTAAGRAGVEFPKAIYLLSSEDGKAWRPIGNLVDLSAAEGHALPKDYAAHRYRTDALHERGRYVALIIIPRGPFVFCDEIEVYQGQSDGKEAPATVGNLDEYADGILIGQAVQKRLETDAASAHKRVAVAAIAPAVRQALTKELDAIARLISQLPPVSDVKDFTTTFPLNDLHARIFAVNGRLLKAEGYEPLNIWTTNRYDPLLPADAPPTRAEQAKLNVTLMKGESRSATLNLTNATDRPMPVRLRVTGLPGGADPAYLTVYQVPWTDTKAFPDFIRNGMTHWEGTSGSLPVALALVKAGRGSDGAYQVDVPAGMTRQVWFEFHPPRDAAAGDFHGKVEITGADKAAAIALRVLNVEFPAHPTLHVGGWDYTDTDGLYGLTPENVAPLVAMLRQRGVDTPWASSAVWPFGKYDAGGHRTAEPSTDSFDRWIKRWPDAARYAVFAYIKPEIGGFKQGSAGYDAALGQWVTFWVNHAASKGIDVDRLLLLLVDEPRNHKDDQLTIDASRAIKAAQPAMRIWTDPVYPDPADALPDFWKAVDIITPLRPRLNAGGEKAMAFYQARQREGHALELYSCSGPSTRLDPYTYYRLQAWQCFQMGAQGSHFWAFGSVGRGGSWNEYLNSTITYTPVFLSRDSVTLAKPMMAIQEGREDYESLAMLRRAISGLRGADADSTQAQAARRLLEGACRRVLGGSGALVMENGRNMSAQARCDRSMADEVIAEIGRMIESLSHEGHLQN